MLIRRPSPPPSKATVPSARVVRSTSPEATLVSSLSVPRRDVSSQRSMPAKLPVVTEVHVSAVPAEVSSTFRSGLRKFTGAKRAKRLFASLSFPCHMVSRPRPRYSAPCQVTRTRRPRSAAVKGRAVCTTFTPCSTSNRSIGARSEEHTSELQSRPHLVCRLLLEKKKKKQIKAILIKKKKK